VIPRANVARQDGNECVAATGIQNRLDIIRQGQRLEYFTVAYNSLEGLVSIIAGLIAGSVSLVGFGLDSLIEVTSGAALLWRLHHDLNAGRREEVERTTLKIVGSCVVALALYILYESGSALIFQRPPHRSIPGIVIAAVSLVVMPLLGESKAPGRCGHWDRRYARRLQTDGSCTFSVSHCCVGCC
jgi:hypothetical protein